MLSSFFQGMLISPSIIGSSSCWSKVVMCSENSSRKTQIGVPFFVELGGLYISENMFVLDLIFNCTISDSKDSYFCDFNYFISSFSSYIQARPPPFLFSLSYDSIWWPCIFRFAFMYCRSSFFFKSKPQ